MQSDQFLELEYDEKAIAAFVGAENARTEARLIDEAFPADVAAVRAIMEAPDALPSVARRGDWLFTFKMTAENPRGLWLCLPADQVPTPDAAWETMFDVDAFCRETGAVWHWRGAATAWFDPTKVLLRLSLDGSDLTRHVEFDLTTRMIVPGGFDIAPERGGAADWLDQNTLLWICGTGEGALTRSGWPRQVRHLHRNGQSDVVFAVGTEDLLASAYLVKIGDQAYPVHVRMPAINMNASTLMGPNGAVDLPTPADASGFTDGTYFAYLAQSDGAFPTGTLAVGRFGQAPRAVFTPEPRRAVNGDLVFFHEGWLIWTETENLVPRLMALHLETEGAPQVMPVPEGAENFWVGVLDANALGGDGTLVLHVSGFLTPPQSYLFDLHKGVAGITYRPLLAQPTRFNADGLVVELLMARSDDGTEVPYHLVRPKAGGPVPVMLYGYGGYAVSLDPGYDAITGKLWLERGGAYVMAHIRGGGELGPAWWTAAKGPGRHKAFEDFAAIARDLVARGISTPAQIGCHGGSNGGLLCGVMLTRYPERFGAVWANVGVQDMLRYHLFPSGAGWIDEYGDPDDPTARDWLLAYSPLHNIDPTRAYPTALIDTSDSDDRVHPSHSRRFAAALRAAGKDALFYSHAGGHGGGGGSDEKARELALGYAFMRQALGLQAHRAARP